MTRKNDGSRWRLLVCAGGAVFFLFLVTAPFEHHDLICHIKTPQHCASCSSSILGSDPGSPAILDARHLADAGRAFALHFIADDLLLPVRSTGRSPPAHA